MYIFNIYVSKQQVSGKTSSYAMSEMFVFNDFSFQYFLYTLYTYRKTVLSIYHGMYYTVH